MLAPPENYRKNRLMMNVRNRRSQKYRDGKGKYRKTRDRRSLVARLLLGVAAVFLGCLVITTWVFLGKGFGEPADKTGPSKPQSKTDLEVHFIDVGQGDATLIKAGEHSMLIDAGDFRAGTAVQLYLKKQGVDKLDYLVLTHTDADHIGGADVIITKFDIDTIFLGDYQKDTKAYRELMDALEYRNQSYSVPAVGTTWQLGDAAFTIVAPNQTYENPNDSSLALLLQNGAHTFLFTGDCEEAAERDILANGLSVDCDVYQVGHHGSYTSSTKEFLNAITPEYAVISCAKENPYGYPHASVLKRLRSIGTTVLRTDEQGSIVAYSDGNTLTWSCEPEDSGNRKP